MKKYRIPSFIALGVFIICLAVLLLGNTVTPTNIIYYVSLGYGVLCLAFLLFQLYAFAKAHTEYNEEIEDVKYIVFELEKE